MIELTPELTKELRHYLDTNDAAKLQRTFHAMHPTDIATFIDDLSDEDATRALRVLPDVKVADVITEMDQDRRREILSLVPEQEIATKIVQNMDTDDAADLIRDLRSERQDAILAHIPDLEQAGNIVDLLHYDEDTAGGVMRKEHLEAIAAVLRDTDVMVLSDEIYGGLTYGSAPHVSIASLPGMRERTVLVDGFSKSFAMTGWRLGYACAPAPVMKPMVKLHQFALMCAPTTAQYAAVEAMENGDEDVERMRADYDVRRRFIVDELNKMGLTCFEPEGAFYVFPSVKKTGMDSDTFCESLLREKRVAVVPGTAFGDCGEGYVRISYCYSLKHITEAMRRMRAFVEEHAGR